MRLFTSYLVQKGVAIQILQINYDKLLLIEKKQHQE